MSASSIVIALDNLYLARFRCGRTPNQYHGTYVHDAFRICESHAYSVGIEAFVTAGLPLNAIAEAVRVNVLRVFIGGKEVSP